jgi:hypothetical protein
MGRLCDSSLFDGVDIFIYFFEGILEQAYFVVVFVVSDTTNCASHSVNLYRVFNGRSPENLPLSALAFLHSIKSSLLIG